MIGGAAAKKAVSVASLGAVSAMVGCMSSSVTTKATTEKRLEMDNFLCLPASGVELCFNCGTNFLLSATLCRVADAAIWSL